MAAGSSLGDRVRSTGIDLMTGLTSTRAIRRDDPVTETALRDMLFAATRAPSGSNRQPFRFLVLASGEVAACARARSTRPEPMSRAGGR